MSQFSSWSMRFAMALTAVFAIGGLSAGGVSYVLQTHELTSRLSDEVEAIAQGLAHIAEDGTREDLRAQVLAQVEFSHDGSTLVVWIDQATGEAVGNFRPHVLFDGARRLDAERDLMFLGDTPDDTEDPYLAFAIQTPLGPVIAARDTAWIIESGEILIRSTFLGLGAAIVLSFGLALVIAWRNERRIKLMEGVLRDVGKGRLDLRIRDAQRDDLARLAGGVDDTLDRLEAGVETIKQVSTDVAHDLRAPLARLRIKLEPYATDASLPDALRYVFGTTLADIDDISGTFESILRLARLQSGSTDLHREQVDLGALVHEVFEILEAVAEDAGHTIAAAAPVGQMFITGDKELLTQALINLVDNAIRHCTAPTSIEIGAKPGPHGNCVWVADHGPGIPAEQRAKVIERFVRLDRSRTTPGSGLGLSLVQAIATLHKAELVFSDNAPGLRATLNFARD